MDVVVSWNGPSPSGRSRRRVPGIGRILVASLLATVTASAAPENAPAPPPAVAVRTVLDGRSEDRGMQFVFADAKGRPVILRTDPLEVLRARRGGTFDGPTPLGDPRTKRLFVRDAAMDPAGDRFLLLSDNEVWLIGGDQARTLPLLDWIPTAVAFLDGDPVVAVLPTGGPSSGVQGGDRAGSMGPPLVFELSQDRWDPLVERPEGPAPHDLTELLTGSAVRLAAPDRRTLWVAGEYRRDLRRFTAQGRLEDHVVLPGTSELFGPEERREGSRILRAELADQGMAVEGAGVGAMPVHPSVRGVTATHDGTLYVLAAGDGKNNVLYRYDATNGRLDRCRVAAAGATRATLAAASEGLLVAPQPARFGVVMVPWDRLEATPWLEETPSSGTKP